MKKKKKKNNEIPNKTYIDSAGRVIENNIETNKNEKEISSKNDNLNNIVEEVSRNKNEFPKNEIVEDESDEDDNEEIPIEELNKFKKTKKSDEDENELKQEKTKLRASKKVMPSKMIEDTLPAGTTTVKQTIVEEQSNVIKGIDTEIPNKNKESFDKEVSSQFKKESMEPVGKEKESKKYKKEIKDNKSQNNIINENDKNVMIDEENEIKENEINKTKEKPKKEKDEISNKKIKSNIIETPSNKI